MHLYSEMEIMPTLKRRHASTLRKLLLGKKEFVEIVKQIDEGLKPMHKYSVRCSGCGHEYECVSEDKMTNDQIKNHEKYAICDSCINPEKVLHAHGLVW